jgi:Nucleotide modification associated domain 5
MSIRLNADLRSTICEAALAHRFNSDIQKLTDERANLARIIYEDVYQLNLKKMLALPDGWLPKSNRIKVQFGEEITALMFNGQLYGRRHLDDMLNRNSETVERVVLASDTRANVMKVYGARDRVALALTQMSNDTATASETIKTARNQTMATLNQFHTVEKLIEKWPEIKPFIPEKQTLVLLPAIAKEKLNELLDLPVA